MQQIISDNSPPLLHSYFFFLKSNQMKKIIFISFCFLFLMTKANSQITKGNWLVGGNVLAP